MEEWSSDLMTPQIGRTAIVTGGLEGIGPEIVRVLAHNRAKVVICSDDVLKGEEALMYIRSRVKDPQVRYENVDLANLDSVKEFSDRFLAANDQLHMLINNAEIKTLPARMNTAQGHEMIFAVNYLSHFALTARLFPLLSRTTDSRVVFLSSREHEKGVIDFFDPETTHLYDSSKAFAQSKLALLIFARELDRRIRKSDLEVKSISASDRGNYRAIFDKILHLTLKTREDPACRTLLFSATSAQARGGHYYEPAWKRGHPGVCESEFAPQARDVMAAEKLWELSEQMCGFKFDLHDLSNVLPFQMREIVQPESYT